MGDLNARVGKWQNIKMDRDDFQQIIEGALQNENIFLHPVRASLDEDSNIGAQVLKDLCKQCDLVIVNGTERGDVTGRKTCHVHNGNSTVDWLLRMLMSN